MKNFKDENLNKYWWHRLYKVLVWIISISLGVWRASVEYENFIYFICIFVIVATSSLLIIGFIYKIIFYIVFGQRITLTKKEKTFLLLGISIIAVSMAVGFVYDEYFYRTVPKTPKTELPSLKMPSLKRPSFEDVELPKF